MESAEDVAFLSGAALGHLHLVVTDDAIPQSLLRQRLALRAAEICVTHTGRPERADALRDAVAFLQPGDSPGPAGEIALSWQRGVERAVSVPALARALPQMEDADLALWVGQGHDAPIARAAAVLQAVLADRPRDQAGALLMSDAALATALGWSHVVPVLALGLARRDLQATDTALRGACHRAICRAAPEVTRMAADLSRRAARLRAVAPKLRAQGSDAAVQQFLSRDAVAATDLSVLRSDRAARRFCDRLVALGVARELTGRNTFRLYGL